ncbi:hypothetical protein Tco_1336299 [Tanacetum coccineum]
MKATMAWRCRACDGCGERLLMFNGFPPMIIGSLLKNGGLGSLSISELIRLLGFPTYEGDTCHGKKGQQRGHIPGVGRQVPGKGKTSIFGSQPRGTYNDAKIDDMLVSRDKVIDPAKEEAKWQRRELDLLRRVVGGGSGTEGESGSGGGGDDQPGGDKDASGDDDKGH